VEYLGIQSPEQSGDGYILMPKAKFYKIARYIPYIGPEQAPNDPTEILKATIWMKSNSAAY
jgi:hypothetical protein